MSVDDNHAALRGGAWNSPGSRWWRCDLHVHTPCTHDYTKGAAVTSSEIVQAAVAAGLDAIAVTDHNAAAMVEELKNAAAQTQPRLVVFPGTEITSSEGVHLLVVFPPGSPPDVTKGYLELVSRASGAAGRLLSRDLDRTHVSGSHSRTAAE